MSDLDPTSVERVQGYWDNLLERGMSRAQVEKLIEQGVARGEFVHEQGPDPSQLIVDVQGTEPVPSVYQEKKLRRLPRVRSVMLFEDDCYVGCAVLDTSYWMPREDSRRFLGDEAQILEFFADYCCIGQSRSEVMVALDDLAGRLPKLERQEGQTELRLVWEGAAVTRGFLTADGVEQGLQSLDCSLVLVFEGGLLAQMRPSATLMP